MSEPKSLAEQFKDITPDRHTMAWLLKELAEIREGYQGATHGSNKCWAECANCWQAFAALEKEVEVVKKQRQEDAAEIGRLRAEVTEIQEARKAYQAKRGKAG